MRIWESIYLLFVAMTASAVRFWDGVNRVTNAAILDAKVIKRGICGPFLPAFTYDNAIKTIRYTETLRNYTFEGDPLLASNPSDLQNSTDKGLFPLRTHQNCGFMGIFAQAGIGLSRKETSQ